MTMAPRDTGIVARDLVKTYPGDVRALDGLSLSVEPGAVFGLLGPNGAGKSTTVKILTTLSRPDSGSATVAGHDVLREPGPTRRAIGSVSQRSAIDPEATGRENLALQGRLFGMGGSRAGDRGSPSSSTGSSWARRPTGSPGPTPAGCSGSSTSRWAWSTGRPSSSSTSRPPVSIRRPGPSSGTRSDGSPVRTA